MSRSWTEFIAAVGDVIPLRWLLLILTALTTLVAVLWYTYPAWIPRRNPFARLRLRRRTKEPQERRARGWRWRLRLRWPSWRLRWPRLHWPWRRKTKSSTAKTIDEQIAEVLAAEETLPEVPVEIYLSLADRLAAEGR